LMWVLLWGLLLVLGVGVGGLYLKQQLQVRQLLGEAEQRLQAGQLVEPQQDSADYYFQQVLQLDAGNARALEGLQRVQNQRIANFIGSAESAIQEQRLLLPEDDSAVFYFRQVLLLEPDNARAQTGLQQIAELYRDKAKQAYQRLAFPVALEMIDAGLHVQPDNPELLQMRREHLQLKASTKAAVTDSRKRQAAQQKAAAPAPKAEESLLDKVTNGWNSIWGN